MAKHNVIGILGEKFAAEYLAEEGYHILDRNWRFKKMELDIIALKDEYLVVVEVKSREVDYFDHLADVITPAKIRFLVKATQAYVDLKDIKQEVRFDVISVKIREEKLQELEHIEDAFIAPVG